MTTGVQNVVAKQDKDPRTAMYVRKVEPYLDKITSMKGQNKTDREIAVILDITPSSFYRLKRSVPELEAAYRDGMNEMIHAVESATFREAIGYEYEEQAVVPKTGEIVTITKYARGNATAQKYILSNKKSKEYSDKRQIETTTKVEHDLGILKELTVSELRKLMLEMSDDVEVIDID